MVLVLLAVFACLSLAALVWLAEPLVVPAFDAPEKLWQANFKPELVSKVLTKREVCAIEQIHQMQELLLLHGRKRQLLQRDFLEFADRCWNLGDYESAQSYYAQAGHNIFPDDHYLEVPDMIRCFNRAADLLFIKGEYKSAIGFYERALPLLDNWGEVKPTALTPVFTGGALRQFGRHKLQTAGKRQKMGATCSGSRRQR